MMNSLYQSILNISPKSPLNECPSLGVPASVRVQKVCGAAAAKALQGHLTFWSPLTLFATIDLSYYCTVTYSYNIDQHGGLSIVQILYIFPNVEYRTILYLHILLNGTLLRNLDFYHLTFSKTFKSFSKLFPEIGKQTKSFLT